MKKKYYFKSTLAFLCIVSISILGCTDGGTRSFISMEETKVQLPLKQEMQCHLDSENGSNAESSKTEEAEKTGSASVVYEVKKTQMPHEFEFNLPELHENNHYYLAYDLFGLEDYTGMARSINEQLSVGGYQAVRNQEWKEQKESVSPHVLHKGKNKFRVHSSSYSDFPIQIRNIRLISKPLKKKNNRSLILNQPTTAYYFQELGYVQGYVTGKDYEQAQIIINQDSVRIYKGQFESMVSQPEQSGKDWSVTVTAVFPDGEQLTASVCFDHPVKWETVNGFDPAIHTTERDLYKRDSFSIHLQGVSLCGDANSLNEDKHISITALREQDMALLLGGLVNVSGGVGKGYRMLPHGDFFSTPVHIVMDYDTASLPKGYLPDDIFTYYYDELYNRWQLLPRDSVDTVNHKIYSQTTHFTDFINAILKTPEMPEAYAHTPTGIKDFETPSPLEGITLMQPPTANNMGTVNLSYPIEVPAANNGMQPQLNLTYNSSGGNGWLGLGWEISIPAITIETRWGVPHFDPFKETETYVLNGQQLVTRDENGTADKPVFRQEEKKDRIITEYLKKFYPRVEGDFNQIIRHGNSTINYWWEVIDKNGVHYYYGKKANEKEFEPNAVLRDQLGNIAHWALTEVKDPFGYKVSYYYTIVQETSNAVNKGKQIYIESILYSRYRIDFIREDKKRYKRPDIQINARCGFKEVTEDLLREIKVSCNNQFIKAYVFEMENDTHSYFKSRLLGFACMDSAQYFFINKIDLFRNRKAVLFTKPEHVPDNPGLYYTYAPFAYSHKFNYNNALKNPYSKEKLLIDTKDKVKGKLNPLKEKNISILGGSQSSGYTAGGAMTIGFGYNVFMKTLSAGGNYSYSNSESKGLVCLIDIDGDGLPDKVFNENGQLYCSRQEYSEGRRKFRDKELFNPGVSSFLSESSSSHSTGVEAHAKIAGAGGNGSKSWTWNTSATHTYFSDVNGDGLPDIVDGDKIFYNTTKKNGLITFAEKLFDTIMVGGRCENPEFIVVKPGKVDKSAFESGYHVFEGYETYREYWERIDNPGGGNWYVNHRLGTLSINSDTIIKLSNTEGVSFTRRYDTVYWEKPRPITPSIDPVRMWIAPYKGTITVSSTVELTRNLQDERLKNEILDGVLVTVQQNDRIIYSKTIVPHKANGKASIDKTLDVYPGDRLYFRTESVDERLLDVVQWDPLIQYTSYFANNERITAVEKPDANHQNALRFKASEDFMLKATTHPQMPLKGTIRIEAPYQVMASLSDDAVLKIYKNGSEQWSQTIRNQTNEMLEGYSMTFPVDTGDIFECKVLCPTQVKWTDIVWKPHIYYTNATQESQAVDVIDAETGAYLYEYYLAPNKQYYDYNKIPSPALTLNGISNIKLILTKDNTPVNGLVLLSVKSQDNTLIRRIELNVNTSAGIWEKDLSFSLPEGIYYIDVHTHDAALGESVARTECILNNSIRTVIGFYCDYKPEMARFGGLYRGWGQFSYQNVYNNQTPIDEKLLSSQSMASVKESDFSEEKINKTIKGFDNDQTTSTTTGLNIINLNESTGFYNPSNKAFLPMEADAKTDSWKCFGTGAYIRKDTISNLLDKKRADGTQITIDLSESPYPMVNPRADQKTVVKRVRNYSTSWSGGLSLGLAGFGGSRTKGEVTIESDFLDMNGDRFPDIISENQIQYTNSLGALSERKIPLVQNEISSTYKGEGKTMGITPMIGGAEVSTNIRKLTIAAKGNMGTISSNEGWTDDKTHYSWVDINGDGLPDKVMDNGKVQLNLGYTFAYPEDWGFGNISEGKSTSNAISLGLPGSFDIGGSSISGGIGGYNSTNESLRTFMDVNGDGLPDMLIKQANSLVVRLNMGNRFAEPIPWLNGGAINQSISQGTSANVAVTFGFTIGFIPAKILMNPNGGGSWSINETKEQLFDLNGNGYPAHIKENDGILSVATSRIVETNLLSSYTNSLGAICHIAYEYLPPSYDMPQWQLVMSSVRVQPALANSADNFHTTYTYQDPYHDRFERQSFGYGQVTSTQHKGTGIAPYRILSEFYHNSKYDLKGLKYKEQLKTEDGKMLTEKRTHFVIKEISSGAIIQENLAHCYGNGYPAVYSDTTSYYDGYSTPQIRTGKRWIHGPYGNITEYTNGGDVSNADDDLMAEIEYTYDLQENILTNVSELRVYGMENENKKLLKRRTAPSYINTKPTAIIEWDNANQYRIDLKYSGSNIAEIKYPINAAGQQMIYSCKYDNFVGIYPVVISNSLGYSSSIAYNYLIGKPTCITDIAGRQTEYTYDGLGRILTIRGPKEIANGIAYTKKFIYEDFREMTYYSQINVESNNDFEAGGKQSVVITGPPVSFQNISQLYSLANKNAISVLAFQYDPDNPGNDLVSCLRFDALGRLIISRIEQEVQGEEKIIQSEISYDMVGRKVKERNAMVCSLPASYTQSHKINSIEPLDYTINHSVLREVTQIVWEVPSNTYANTVVTSYDVQDRPLATIIQDSMGNQLNKISISYGFGNDNYGRKQLKTTTTDYSNRIFETFTHPMGYVTTEKPSNTQYKYNSLGQLLESTDGDNHTTRYQYDGFGRKTQRIHPDAGTTSWEYDPAGNVVSLQTQDLKNKNKKISYLYEYNRLQEVRYPTDSMNNILYQYGPSGSGNSTGRLIRVSDASGMRQFEYGDMGEISKEIRYITLPSETNPLKISTGFTYDSYNRIKTIEYPDGETVQYLYNTGGQLKQVKSEGNADLIKRIEYDKFGNKISIEYGNNTREQFVYDKQQRLVESDLPNQAKLLYSYDNSNNVKTMQNSWTSFQSGNKVVNNTYDYDQMNRLIKASAKEISNPALSYTIEMGYTWSGKITTKKQIRNGNVSDLSYSYQNGTHKLVSISGSIEVGTQYLRWDANGNLSVHTSADGAINRKQYWDEENRMVWAQNDKQHAYYLYDASGERAYKNTGNQKIINVQGYWNNPVVALTNPVVYPNAFIAADARHVTKHYYIEGKRFASEITSGTMPGFTAVEIEKAGDISLKDKQTLSRSTARGFMKKTDAQAWHNITDQQISEMLSGTRLSDGKIYYHTDHLGSTSSVTDKDGISIQHLQYLPFGETFIEERKVNTSGTPYTFSGKEKDEETGFYYFSARYYNSDLNIFNSVDPLADKKPHISPYAYCLNNPLKYIDPDGRDEWELNSEGKEVNRIPTEKHDAFYIVDENGNRKKDNKGKDIGVTFEHGTVKGSFSYSTTKKDNKGNDMPIDIDLYGISGSKEGETLHRFLSNNTNVEWGATQTGGGLNILSTSHKKGTDYGSADVINFLHRFGNIINITNHDHNHPSNKYSPSRSDRDFAKTLNTWYPYAQTRIYTKESGAYHFYDRDGHLGIDSRSIRRR